MRRRTRWLTADKRGVRAAADLLREGGLVAFPTETVYGLGAHALDRAAVLGIFRAKKRPADDPLIVHVLDTAAAARLAHLDARAQVLARAFWPGPLTLVVPRRQVVPLEVTAGLESVGIRVPAHAVARALLDSSGLPLAAPSANLFARPSPTRAEHVLADLGGRIDAILDGGPTLVGVESTIVSLLDDEPRLLRAGGIDAESIEAVLDRSLAEPSDEGVVLAPGMLGTHYAPRTRLILVTGPPEAARLRLSSAVEAALADGQRVGVLLLDEDRGLIPSAAVVAPVGSWRAPVTAAARLYDALRSLDGVGLDVVFTRQLADPNVGLGRALADRLRRAAAEIVSARAQDGAC